MGSHAGVEIAGHSRLTAKTAELSREHPRLPLLYGAAYSPHDNPVECIWAADAGHRRAVDLTLAAPQVRAELQRSRLF